MLAIAALAIAAQLAFDIRLPEAAELPFQVVLVALAAVMLLQRHRPARFFALACWRSSLPAYGSPASTAIETARSFFGVHHVVETTDNRHRLLYHGTTLHGAERIDDGHGPQVAAGAADLFLFRRADFGDASRRCAMRMADCRGLRRSGSAPAASRATGAAAKQWTFFEIDPDVVRIARDPRFFSFLSSCAPERPSCWAMRGSRSRRRRSASI